MCFFFQSMYTKNYLKSTHSQDCHYLPDGPLLVTPFSLYKAFKKYNNDFNDYIHIYWRGSFFFLKRGDWTQARRIQNIVFTANKNVLSGWIQSLSCRIWKQAKCMLLMMCSSCPYDIQWNLLSIVDTIGTGQSVLTIEVSLFQSVPD